MIALTPLLLGLGSAALLLVMAVVFAETGLFFGFFLPGDSLLFTLGVLVAASSVHLPLGVVVFAVGAAAFAGDQVGYLLGRRFGPRLVGRARSRWFSPSHVVRAQALFDRHGSKAVILARFIPVVRTFTPVVAGVAGMPRRQFTTYNLVGAALWGGALISTGFFLGGVPLVAAHVELVAVALAGLSVVPASIALVQSRGRSRSARRSLEASAAASQATLVDLAA